MGIDNQKLMMMMIRKGRRIACSESSMAYRIEV